MSASRTGLATPFRQSSSNSSPKLRLRHYGIVVLFFAALSTFMSAPGQTHSMSAFVDPMVNDLGLKQTTYSTAYMVATAIAALTYSLMGRLLDKYGARSLMPIGAAALGGACCVMSAVPSDFVAVLYLGMFLCRLFGQGLMCLVSTWLVGEWFEKRRGLAMGVVGLGGSLSVMIVAGFNNSMIEMHGWRQAWMVLATILWISAVLPSILFVRNRPEPLGLLPDLRLTGDPDIEIQTKLDRDGNAEITTDSWTANEAMKTATFWKLVAGMSTWAMVGTGLAFYQASLLERIDVSRQYAFWLFAVQAGSAICSSFVAGYFTGKIPARYLLFVSVAGLACGVVLLLTITKPWMAIFYSIMLGLNGGILRSTGMVVWVNYFGRKHQGAVAGSAMSICAIASALGPLPLALSFDQFGSHQPALLAFLTIAICASYAVFTARPPQKQPAPVQA
tara:strand:+ start:237 stop:1577 length:1341 start_codon:yes stop_codon:yes gene_type:complete